MAIPSWLWPNDRSEQPSEGRLANPNEAPDTTEIKNATNTFEVLSNTTRLEVLATLYSRTDPLTYTEIREATSVTDKGKFNYHLRRLDEFLSHQDGRYALNTHGCDLLQSVFTEDEILRYK